MLSLKAPARVPHHDFFNCSDGLGNVSLEEVRQSCKTSEFLQGRNDSGSGTDPPSGALPQLVTPEGGADRSNLPGPDIGGRARQDDSGGKSGPSEGKPGGKAASADFTEASASVADLAVPARPDAPLPPLGTSVPGMLQVSRSYQNASVSYVRLHTPRRACEK